MEFEEKQPINATIISHVSCHGKAFYIYISRDAAQAYNIFSEDKVEIQLGRHWKPKRKDAEDLTVKEKTKKGK